VGRHNRAGNGKECARAGNILPQECAIPQIAGKVNDRTKMRIHFQILRQAKKHNRKYSQGAAINVAAGENISRSDCVGPRSSNQIGEDKLRYTNANLSISLIALAASTIIQPALAQITGADAAPQSPIRN